MSSQGHAGNTLEDDFPGINISRIRIGGDLGGLFFVVGTVGCLLIGVPTARPFFADTMAGGCLLAIALGWWHRRHQWPDVEETVELGVGRHAGAALKGRSSSPA
jgi:hypothetical protein